MKTSKKKRPQIDLARLEQEIARLGIQQWDLLLFGDGSGCRAENPCGWATVSVDRHWQCRFWYGMMNCGSNNLAELLAYLQPLSWFVEQEKARRKQRQAKARFYRVHIVTDSEYCQKQGETGVTDSRSHPVLWQMVEHFRREGLLLHWHAIPRATYTLNILTDQISREARLVLEKNAIPSMPRIQAPAV